MVKIYNVYINDVRKPENPTPKHGEEHIVRVFMGCGKIGTGRIMEIKLQYTDWWYPISEIHIYPTMDCKIIRSF